MNAPVNSSSFANVTREEALQRAAALIPLLREHAATAEAERHLAAPVRDALHRAGLFRFLQPKTRGGMELDFAAWVEIPEMLGRGDCSTAWNVVNLALAPSHAGAVQQTGAGRGVGRESRCADRRRHRLSAGPREKSRRWPDPVRHLEFLLGGDRFELEHAGLHGAWKNDKPVDWVQCLLREGEYTIIDDWQTMGMRGTGSCTVKVEDCSCRNTACSRWRPPCRDTATPA